MQPESPRLSWARRLAFGAAAGAAAGLCAGAVEGAALNWITGIGRRAPQAELLHSELRYLLFGAALGLLLGLLFRRHHGARAAGTWAGFMVLMWAVEIWKRQYSTLGLLGFVALSLAVAYLVYRLTRPLLAAPRRALAAAALLLLGAHGAAQLSSVDRASEAYAGIVPWSGERPPNLLLILIDTLRADRLSCYGYERPTSPVLDELAARGTRFDAAYASASWTRPSVASLLTGLYPSSHDILGELDVLPASLPTLAGVLRARGYRTAGFSANPQVSEVYGFDHGFDEFQGVGTARAYRRCALGRFEHFGRAFAFLKLLPALGLRKGAAGAARLAAAEEAAQEEGPPEHSSAHAGMLNKKVFPWISSQDGAQPFFLYVHYIDPHSPYAPPEDLINEDGQKPVPLPVTLIDKNVPPYPFHSFGEAAPEVMAGLSKLYDAEIRFVDREIGRLLEQLEQRGWLEDTVVLVTADHGEEFHDHQQWLHGHSLFDELVRVPWIVAGPAVERQVVSGPVTLVDVLPTLAAAAGAALEGVPSHGQDLGPVLRGEAAADPERAVLSERHSHWDITALRQGARKLIRIVSPEQEERWLQFDLAADPRELQDLAAGAAPDAALRRLFDQLSSQAGALLRERSGKAQASGAVAAELAELGYAEGERDEE